MELSDQERDLIDHLRGKDNYDPDRELEKIIDDSIADLSNYTDDKSAVAEDIKHCLLKNRQETHEARKEIHDFRADEKKENQIIIEAIISIKKKMGKFFVTALIIVGISMFVLGIVVCANKTVVKEYAKPILSVAEWLIKSKTGGE